MSTWFMNVSSVCESTSGHWHVVGLYHFGIAPAGTPEVVTNIHQYNDFITAPRHRRNLQCLENGKNWQQGCQENIIDEPSQKNCGQRGKVDGSNGPNPAEFPWNCLILTKEDKFVANCVIVPENSQNSIQNGTRIVSTLASKVKKFEDPW